MHDMADSDPNLRQAMEQRYNELAKLMNKPNGFDDILQRRLMHSVMLSLDSRLRLR